MLGVSRIGALWAVAITMQSCNGQFASDVCPDEISVCLQDTECFQCIGVLTQNFGTSDVDGLPCDEIFSGLCLVVEAECNATNSAVLELFGCVTRDAFECPGFTTCADFSSATLPPGATIAPAPTPAPMLEGSPAPVMEGTPAPSAAPTMMAPTTASPTDNGEDTDAAASGGISRFAAAGILFPTFGLGLASAAFAVLLGQ